jgi:hypothetical protein
LLLFAACSDVGKDLFRDEFDAGGLLPLKQHFRLIQRLRQDLARLGMFRADLPLVRLEGDGFPYRLIDLPQRDHVTSDIGLDV